MDKTFLESFESKPLSKTQVGAVKKTRDSYREFAKLLMQTLPPGRHRALCLTKIEQSAMHATKSISHEWDIADD